MSSILVDFDGTIVEHKYPNIGSPLPGAIDTLKALKERGYKLVLWTCREDNPKGRKYLTEAVEFCKSNGIEFDAINEPLDDDFRKDFCDSPRKPHCKYHIDDHNFDGFSGWDWVRTRLIGE